MTATRGAHGSGAPRPPETDCYDADAQPARAAPDMDPSASRTPTEPRRVPSWVGQWAPMVMAVVAILTFTDIRLARTEDRLGARMDRLGARMDRLSARMDRLEDRMDRRLAKIEDRLLALEVRMQDLEVRMQDLEARMRDVEIRLRELEDRVGSLEQEVARMRGILGLPEDPGGAARPVAGAQAPEAAP